MDWLFRFKDVAQAVAREGARFHFTAFDALKCPCADLAIFRQYLLRDAFLLSEFGLLLAVL